MLPHPLKHCIPAHPFPQRPGGLKVWLVAGVVAAVALGAGAAPPAARPPEARYSLEEAQTTVRLLADYYRTNLLELHLAYVKDGGIAPSATVLKQVFKRMTALGWPRARWLAVNGRPLNPDNIPQGDFEIEGGRRVRHGTELFERVEKDRYLAVAAIPFSGPCLKCHWGDKPNDYVGGISFSLALSRAGR